MTAKSRMTSAARMLFHCILDGTPTIHMFATAAQRDAIMDEVDALIDQIDIVDTAAMKESAANLRRNSPIASDAKLAGNNSGFAIIDEWPWDDRDESMRHFCRRSEQNAVERLIGGVT